MNRKHVSFDEFEFGSITREVSSLDEIANGELFITVRFPYGSGDNWPVYEKTTTGYRPVDPKVRKLSHIPSGYTFHRVIG